MNTKKVNELDEETFRKYLDLFLNDAKRRQIEAPALATLRSELDALKLKYEQLEVIAADVNEWLKTSANLKGSAHQRELEAALAGNE